MNYKIIKDIPLGNNKFKKEIVGFADTKEKAERMVLTLRNLMQNQLYYYN